MRRRRRKQKRVQRGGANVFRDLGVKHPERVLVRAQVMSCIADLIRSRGLTQTEASDILGIPQSKVSCLMNGKLSLFSLDHLFELLNALDRNVKIVIQPKPPAQPTATTKVA